MTKHPWIPLIIQSWLSDAKWFRRWQGGHWERWWVPINDTEKSYIWLHIPTGCTGPYTVSHVACEQW